MVTSIKLWARACEEINLKYEIFHPSKSLLRIWINDKIYYFSNLHTPFNEQSLAELLKDKEYCYHILKNYSHLPKTQGFISPFCKELYQPYIHEKSIEAIATTINNQFSLPMMIKKNKGSCGINVFRCDKRQDIDLALTEIFNPQSSEYDDVAIAQDYIPIVHEYRAIFFQSKLVLLYEKDNHSAQQTGNISPLHWEGAIARHITDSTLITTLENFIQPVFKVLPITYTGLDIASDPEGIYWLIEMNSSPGYHLFLKDNNAQIIIELFKNILINFMVLINKSRKSGRNY